MNRQEELTEILSKASESYYTSGITIMSDKEFDTLIEELKKLEKENGIVLENSPTKNVGAKPLDTLEKSEHEEPALSLDKVKYKDRFQGLDKWLNIVDNKAVMTWKADGLTVVATYDDGKLTKAVTRGNGTEGSVITHNAIYFKGLPRNIKYKGHLVVHGECVMTIKEFDRINALKNDIYENPRNLASATVQMLDVNESRKREIIFEAFKLVKPLPDETLRYEDERLDFLSNLGFNVVEHQVVDKDNYIDSIENFKNKIEKNEYPTDGLVFASYDSLKGKELGTTGHHPRSSIALKWTDETVETTIKEIEWSVGKTGVITPVAIFDTVRLGLGSNVSKASVHNLTVMSNIPSTNGDKGLKIGSNVEVYLANMIIPQIATVSNNRNEEEIEIPKYCPICGEKTKIIERNGIQTLNCVNEKCLARTIGGLVNTFSKDGLFVKGLGESQIKDLVEENIATTDAVSFYDLTVKENKELPKPLEDKSGWGKKKWDNIIKSLEKSKKTTIPKFLYSLNIQLMGKDLSKKTAKILNNDINILLSAVRDKNKKDELIEKMKNENGIGDIKAECFNEWLTELNNNIDKRNNFEKLVSYLEFPINQDINEDNSLSGLTFVITGKVNEYKNRNEFKESVENRGGKVSGSVSNNTNYLVINDLTSQSSKAKKARKLGIELISENDFIEKFGK